MLQGIADGCLHIFQLIAAPVISSIALRNGADDADAHGIKARIHNLPDALRITGIGIDVNLPPAGFSTNQTDACADIVRCQGRLPLATLPKADNPLRGSLQVINADFCNFLRRRTEFYPALR